MQKFYIFSCLLIIINIGVQQTDALRCYACTLTSTSGEEECITHPSSLGGQNIVSCSKKYCVILRQELKDPRGKVNSFSRGCEEAPLYLNDVVEDSTFKTYYRACTTDLCNSGDGLRNGLVVSPDGGAGENMLVPGLRGNGGSFKSPYSFCLLITLIYILFN